MTTKTCSWIQATKTVFCFSNNVVKTCSCGIKISRNIEIKYLFHFKAYFQVNISCKLSKFLWLYKTEPLTSQSKSKYFLFEKFPLYCHFVTKFQQTPIKIKSSILVTGSLHSSMKCLTKVYLFSVYVCYSIERVLYFVLLSVHDVFPSL